MSLVRNRDRSAFTLIELLVVIAIIAILIGLGTFSSRKPWRGQLMTELLWRQSE